MSSHGMTKFCWECGSQFQPGARPVILMLQGYTRTLHKACAESDSVYNELHQPTALPRLENRG